MQKHHVTRFTVPAHRNEVMSVPQLNIQAENDTIILLVVLFHHTCISLQLYLHHEIIVFPQSTTPTTGRRNKNTTSHHREGNPTHREEGEGLALDPEPHTHTYVYIYPLAQTHRRTLIVFALLHESICALSGGLIANLRFEIGI